VTPEFSSLLGPLLDQIASGIAERLRLMVPCSSSSGVSPRLLTVDQAATYLGRTKASLQHMVSAGRLPIVRADRRVFLDVRDLDGWIEQNKEAGVV
jgi:excisionase family DNA binding protein